VIAILRFQFETRLSVGKLRSDIALSVQGVPDEDANHGGHPYNKDGHAALQSRDERGNHFASRGTIGPPASVFSLHTRKAISPSL
jgi:hypothetical protein